MIAVIDNYDSFTYNLVQYLGEMGAQLRVFRNDSVSVADLKVLAPSHLVISPGPGIPDDSGVSLAAIRELGPTVPTLGVCLGHQAIGAVFGGTIQRAPELMHGKTSDIHHSGTDLFQGLPNPFTATRYHSLIVAEPLPKCLLKQAGTNDGILMAIRHRKHPIYGVQFHPESILTEGGKTLLNNFLLLQTNTHKLTK
ncbi:MAG: aminodeoxychorismate/anthranilate synthase component II [Anaerolineales bacterium]|nr:aminodeoxychorismate/anthranilate synthase component II [Anaerolineales bacterium]